MRIALVHYSAPPVIGGVERVLAGQATVLARRGHEVTVLCGNPGASIPGVRTMAVSDLGAQPGVPLATALAEQEAVVVHNLFTMPFNLPVTRQLRQLAVEWNKVLWVNWVHDVAAINPAYAHLPWEDADHAMLRQPAPNCVNVAVSELRRREYLDLLRLPPTACQVVPNGIDVASILGLTPRIAALAESTGLWDRECVLLHPARLLRRKNVELTLRVTRALADLGLQPLTLISGAPDPHNAASAAYAQELLQLRASLGLEETVRFLGEDGALDEADIRSLYAVSDALFFPSHTEGFGLPLLEAMLHGVPSFCSDIAVHREVAGTWASFFPLEDPPEAIATLITENPAVTARYERRLLVASQLDWERLYDSHLSTILER